ncbi:MAG: HDOD domain-containing protein [bacterium]|nr:HDOD domain-containing protein [bacterium]
MVSFLSSRDSTRELSRIFAGETARFEFPGLTDARFGAISGFVYRLLSHYDLTYLNEMVLVLLKEIISNCSKANAKRIYFETMKTDVSTNAGYDRAIQNFSQQVLRDWDVFLHDNQDSRYYIRVDVRATDEHLIFIIENNIELLPREKERIQKKFESFKKFHDINSAFSEIRDESEGAGLGIFLILSLLDNVQVSADNYRIVSEAGVTRNEVYLPRKITNEKFQNEFYKRVLKEVEDLPSFPENITYLLSLCDSETASVSVIAGHIQKDPALTAQILKLVNSAGYMNRFRNPGLEDAVKIIGLKVIRNLLMVTGARNVINRKYRVKDLEAVWEASNRVSFFARRLAKTRPGGQILAEQVTVAGLLCELGKIVLLSLNPEAVATIQKMLGARRARNSATLEETLLGISHPEIGGYMAEHWNFPPNLVASIRYQQKPLQSPEEFSEGVGAIYTAVAIHQTSVDQIEYSSLEPQVLERFEIEDEERFRSTVEQFDADFKSSNELY